MSTGGLQKTFNFPSIFSVSPVIVLGRSKRNLYRPWLTYLIDVVDPQADIDWNNLRAFIDIYVVHLQIQKLYIDLKGKIAKVNTNASQNFKS